MWRKGKDTQIRGEPNNGNDNTEPTNNRMIPKEKTKKEMLRLVGLSAILGLLFLMAVFMMLMHLFSGDTTLQMVAIISDFGLVLVFGGGGGGGICCLVGRKDSRPTMRLFKFFAVIMVVGALIVFIINIAARVGVI